MNWPRGSANSKLTVQIFIQAISDEQLQMPAIDNVLTQRLARSPLATRSEAHALRTYRWATPAIA